MKVQTDADDARVIMGLQYGVTTAPDLIAAHSTFVNQLKQSQDQRNCVGDVNGVLTETRPFYTDRKTERAQVLLGPEKLYFACEWTSIPWSIFRSITTSYWVWVDRTSQFKAQEILTKAGVKDGHIEEDPYAIPTRYHVWVKTLEDVVAIYKIIPKVTHRKNLHLQRESEAAEDADQRRCGIGKYYWAIVPYQKAA